LKTTQGKPARSAAFRGGSRSRPKSGSVAALTARLIESEETLRAIRSGEVDAVLLAGKNGNQVFSLEGAEHAYRVLIESMNEGALTLTADKMILYANECFARMVKCPLQQVMGGSFRRFLSATDRASLRSFLRRPEADGAKFQMQLHAADGSWLPVQISIPPRMGKRSDDATFSMVVTDMTEAHRNVEMLRALTHRVVQVQEAERGRIALELHDNITQLLCAVVYRSQALAEGISAADGPAKQEAVGLREMLGQAAAEVERISRNLRPGMLEQLGLVEVLRDATKDFAEQARVSVKLTCAELTARLPADTELALYRILQEAFQNVRKHARAHHVSVSFKSEAGFVELLIKDDGVGFDAAKRSSARKINRGLGLLGMRERAAYIGGSVEIASARRAGTEIKVRVPVTVVSMAKAGPHAGAVSEASPRARAR
jgi:two-component system, NarL family, sensor kinase